MSFYMHMDGHDYAEVDRVDDLEPEQAVRLYRASIYHGGQWVLQVRACQALKSGGHGRRVFVASAHVGRGALEKIRDAINAELAAMVHEGGA